MFFASVEEMERSPEVVDVKNHQYIAYDSEGRLITLGTIQSKGLRERVSVQSVETEPTHVPELQKILLEFFMRVGVPEDWLAGASLEDLVRAGIERYRIK